MRDVLGKASIIPVDSFPGALVMASTFLCDAGDRLGRSERLIMKA
jgi:hypothetical protein